MYYGKPRPQNAEEFVAMWRQQAEEHFQDIAAPESQSFYGQTFPLEHYTDKQRAQIENLLRITIRESYANVLAGLDGVTVAGVYQKYTVLNEDGKQLVPSEDFTLGWQRLSD